MANFLVKYDAIVGRTKADGGAMPAVEFSFCTVVSAATAEAANDAIIQYKDPGFVISIANITELPESGEALSSALLSALTSSGAMKEQTV